MTHRFDSHLPAVMTAVCNVERLQISKNNFSQSSGIAKNSVQLRAHGKEENVAQVLGMAKL